jgi:hypothetical protein
MPHSIVLLLGLMAAWLNTCAAQCPAGSAGVYPDQCHECLVGTYAPSPGLSLCLACPPGLVATDFGQTECYACPAHQRAIGTFRCEECPVGHYVTPNGTCNPCPAGTAYSAETMTCVACAVGTYAPFPGMQSCISCPPGEYQNEVGANRCKKCPKNTVTSTNATSDRCVPCPAGQGTFRAGDPECVDESVLPGGHGTMDIQTTMVLLVIVAGFLFLAGATEALSIRFLNWEYDKAKVQSQAAMKVSREMAETLHMEAKKHKSQPLGAEEEEGDG